MFKYYINILFYCFTPYYKCSEKYYGILYYVYKFSIFLCAVYKKYGFEDQDQKQQTAFSFPSFPNRFAVRYCVIEPSGCISKLKNFGRFF
jgi:hypothetical protein